VAVAGYIGTATRLVSGGRHVVRSSIGEGGGGSACVLERGFDRDEENRCGFFQFYTMSQNVVGSGSNRVESGTH